MSDRHHPARRYPKQGAILRRNLIQPHSSAASHSEIPRISYVPASEPDALRTRDICMACQDKNIQTALSRLRTLTFKISGWCLHTDKNFQWRFSSFYSLEVLKTGMYRDNQNFWWSSDLICSLEVHLHVPAFHTIRRNDQGTVRFPVSRTLINAHATMQPWWSCRNVNYIRKGASDLRPQKRND